jgi:hypothetical protein
VFWVFKKAQGGAPAVEAGLNIKSKTDRFVPPSVYKSSAVRLVIGATADQLKLCNFLSRGRKVTGIKNA